MGDISFMGKNPTQPPAENGQSQGLSTLLVMIAVLGIILLFCFLGAPGVRDLCKRKVFKCCFPNENQDINPSEDGSATPTIILLPFGRMLVVDRSVFTQLQADHTGIDFMELSANIIRAHQMQYASTPSILDSETTSKGLSPTSLGFSPPSYDDIFGEKNADLPPSYSEVSLMFRHLNKVNEDFKVTTNGVYSRVPQLEEGPKEDLESVVVHGGGVGVRNSVVSRSESDIDGVVRQTVSVVPTLNNCVQVSRSCYSVRLVRESFIDDTLRESSL